MYKGYMDTTYIYEASLPLLFITLEIDGREKKLPVDVSGASFIIEEHKPISRIVVHLGQKKENGLVILDLTRTRSRREWFWFEDGFLPTHRE